jgi:integrase
MACIIKGGKRGRPGRWIVDYRDGAGIRRRITCRTREKAEDVLAEKVRESRQAVRPAVNPNITMTEYSKRWLGLIASSVKPGTKDSYDLHLRLHILPVFGATKVRQMTRGRIRAFLAEKLTTKLSRSTVRITHATLRVMLNSAMDDGVILANPADRLGRQLRLTTSAKHREQEIKAFDRVQLAKFIQKAREHEPRYFALFFTLARTGLRLGEAFGLQWQDLDFDAREIRILRAISRGEVGTPKSGRTRVVDMSQELHAVLRRLRIQRKEETLSRGWGEVPAWLFCTETGATMDQSKVSKAFKRVLTKAELPLHFHPHCLRHTFASLLLQQGESPVYVQRQLGHASIQLTVDTYGRWLPMGNKAAVDRLDDHPVASAKKRRGHKVVTKTVGSAEKWRAQRDLNPRPTDSKSGALSS